MAILKRTTKKEAVAENMVDMAAPKSAMKGVDALRVLLRPLLSEKSSMQEQMGQYTFLIHPTATKISVKHAVKSVYGVEPKKVHILHVDGKVKQYGRFTGTRSAIKKAIVFIPKGKSINIHEGV